MKRPGLPQVDEPQTGLLLPLEPRQGQDHLCFIFYGPSMRPTLGTGDLLLVAPSPGRVGRGDVIVFACPWQPGFVAHRITAMHADHVLTRGDGNRRRDPQPILRSAVIGRVLFREVQGRRMPVAGGWWGALWGTALAVQRHIEHCLKVLFWFPYDLLRRSRITPLFWKPRLSRIRFLYKDGVLVKFTHRGRTVAVWQPISASLHCRKPYDLVIPPLLKDGGSNSRKK